MNKKISFLDDMKKPCISRLAFIVYLVLLLGVLESHNTIVTLVFLCSQTFLLSFLTSKTP